MNKILVSLCLMLTGSIASAETAAETTYFNNASITRISCSRPAVRRPYVNSWVAGVIELKTEDGTPAEVIINAYNHCERLYMEHLCLNLSKLASDKKTVDIPYSEFYYLISPEETHYQYAGVKCVKR